MLVTDPAARQWRKEHKAEVERQIQPFLDKVYRRSQSQKSVQNKYVGVAVFCGWLRQVPDSILQDVKAGKSDPYRLLDDFVGYLVKIRVSPNTTKNYVAAVKKWLRFSGVELSTDKLRDIVELPVQYSITSDRAPTIEELRDVIVVSKSRGRALISLLASSGIRIGEALSLKVKDIDFGVHPTRIRLRPEITKTRQERWCFVSDEATSFLKEYLGNSLRGGLAGSDGRPVSVEDSYVFLGRHQGLDSNGAAYKKRRNPGDLGGIENKPISYWNADFILTTALKNAGLAEKDDHGRDRIHLHCLRKFFFTRMLAVLGRETTEALMGHHEYLDSAYRRYTLEELGGQYLKAMDTVSVMSSRSVNREEMNKEIQLANYKFYIENSRTGDSPREIMLEAERTKGTRLTVDEQLVLFRREYLLLKEQEGALLEQGERRMMGDEDEPESRQQKVISEGELDRCLDEGWKFMASLPSGKIVVERFG